MDTMEKPKFKMMPGSDTGNSYLLIGRKGNIAVGIKPETFKSGGEFGSVGNTWFGAKLRVAPGHMDGKPVVEFTVLDSGKGLAPEVVARLYEAFHSTKADGMGIGLSLCRSIVESHLGRMRAENLYNDTELTGCRFSFWIPVTESSQPQGSIHSKTTKDTGVSPG